MSTKTKILTVKKNLLDANKTIAMNIRDTLSEKNINMFNVMSSPGSGKTSLISKTILHFQPRIISGVIEGDIASSVDTDKLNSLNIPAYQINTGGGCHLDANMILKSLSHFDLEIVDFLFIENVGNLVCTADFDLGGHYNIVILSIPEGDDKPYKYPTMFTDANIIIVNKTDVLNYFDFDLVAFKELIMGMNPSAQVFTVSAKTGEGMDAWFSWIEHTLS